MRWIKLAISLTLSGLISSTTTSLPAYAQRTELTEVSALLQQVDEAMPAIRTQLLQKTDEISRWRNRQGSPSNPFVDYKLQTLLKEAHSLAKQLNLMETQRLNLHREIAELRVELLKVVDNDIETVATGLAQKNLTATEKQTLTQRLEARLQERKALVANLASTLPVAEFNPHLVPSDTDSLDELQAKAALLSDVRDRMQKSLEETRGNIVRMQRQRLLFEEARHLMDEEAFFAETNFAKTQPTTLSLAGHGVDAKTEGASGATGTNAAAAPQGPAALPENGAANNNALSGAAPVTETPAEHALTPENITAEITPMRRLQMEEMANGKKAAPREKATFAHHIADLKSYESNLGKQLTKINGDLEIVESMIRLLEQGSK